MPEHKNKGFTLIEILIALGLTTFVAAILAGSLTQLTKSQKSLSDQSDALRFYTLLESFMLSNPTNCSTAFATQTVPPLGSTPVNVVLNNFIGFVDGTTGGTILQVGSIVSGNTSNQRLRINSLMVETKPGSIDVPVVSGTITYLRRIARLDIILEQMDANYPTGYRPLPIKYVDVPVYVTAANNVSSCALTVQQQDICNVMGATYSAATQQCIPASQCIFKGTYATSTCSPAYPLCAGPVVNIVTGTASCPTGVIPQNVGNENTPITISCGKKCTTTITQTTNFYLCLDCGP